MLFSFCSPCSIAVDWGVLFTSNSFTVLEGEVVGLRLATLLHLEGLIRPFLYKNQSDSWLWSLVFFSIKFISSSVKLSFRFIPCVFCLISSPLGGWFLKGDIYPKWNGCSCLDRLILSLDKGGSLSLFCVLISSVAPVALLNRVSGSKWRPTAEGTLLISNPLNCSTRFLFFYSCLCAWIIIPGKRLHSHSLCFADFRFGKGHFF